MNNILITGAGQIGQAAHILLRSRTAQKQKSLPRTLAETFSTYQEENVFVGLGLQLWDKYAGESVDKTVDFETASVDEIASLLKSSDISYVINALPFFLNEKIATAAAQAGCHYIDFTEDDVMAEKVQRIYANSSLTCAVKCGLAPGFINYVGHDLAKRIHSPQKLMISVGALPRSVGFVKGDPGSNYNLSWSVDGLVNEYIRPCSVRMNGKEASIPPLTGLETIIIDGREYEAAFTSGGIGSLVKELSHIPNVYYKTLRYPGHYSYVSEVVDRHHGNFDAIKKDFLKKFPYNRHDTIVVYAECVGKTNDSRLVREVFSASFYGVKQLSAIQSTTAGGALSVLELILKGQLKGIINHADVPLASFLNTEIYQSTYSIVKG
jgi:saccharopine dehydrogenase-like NADP-dependent oxidoreductase